jgi:hypothetical protein
MYFILVCSESGDIYYIIGRIFPSIDQRLLLPEISVDRDKRIKFFDYVSAQSLVTSAFPQLALIGIINTCLSKLFIKRLTGFRFFSS